MNMSVSQIIITTPMIKALHATITPWILSGFTGGLIVGDARLGKSKAIRTLGDSIDSYDGDPIPIFYANFAELDKQTRRNVFARIMRGITKKAVNSRATGESLSDDLRIRFTDAAMANSERRVVLFVDEAQELTIDQLFPFVDLTNDLEEWNVSLSVFFVANKDRFQDLANQLLKKKNQFIRERYFNYIHVFYGIRSLEQLTACLAYYDKNAITPTDSRTWLQYYAPAAVEQGFRMVDIADTLWQLWNTNYADRFGYESWGMTYFNRTISIALRFYFRKYWSSNPEDIVGILEKSLEAAGNEPTLTTVFPDDS